MAGGSCQNSLRVATWILGKKNCSKVATFFGCVGVDDFAQKLEEKARADGVNVIYQYNDLLPTEHVQSQLPDIIDRFVQIWQPLTLSQLIMLIYQKIEKFWKKPNISM